jgi:hypothetical protein
VQFRAPTSAKWTDRGGKISRAVKTRSHFRTFFALTTLAACLGVGAAALRASADELDHGFVEPCTMSNVEERHLACEVCAAAFGSQDCDERLKPRGFAKKCRTRGSHAGWDEIWCAARPGIVREPASTFGSGATGLLLGAVATLGVMIAMMKVISRKPAKG